MCLLFFYRKYNPITWWHDELKEYGLRSREFLPSFLSSMAHEYSTSFQIPELYYTTLFEALPGNYVLVLNDAPKFTILAATPAYLSLTGYTKETLMGKGIFEAFPTNPDDPADTGESNLRASLEYVQLRKEPHQLPVHRYDLQNDDGSFTEKYWSVSNKPVFAPNGELVYIIHTAEDITDRIKAQQREDAIRGIEKAYHLFMQAPVAVCIVKGVDYVVELANEQMLQFLGRTDAMVGKPLVESLPEAALQGLIGILDEVRTTAAPYHIPHFPAIILIDGVREQRYFNLVFKPYFQNPTESTPTGIFCIAHNVTKQVLYQKEIEEREHRFRTLIEEATVATALYMGRELRIQYANNIMIGYWGKDASVIGMTFQEAVPELIGQPFFGLLDNVYTTGIPYTGVEEEAYLRVDGQLQPFYFNFTYKALRDRQGNIYGIHHMAIDVTQEVLAKRKLEAAEQKARLAIESADLGTYEIDLRTNEMSTSLRFQKIWGVSNTTDRSAFASVIHPDDLPRRDQAHRESYTTGNLQYEARLISGNNEVRWVRVRGIVLFDQAHQPERLLGVVQDITEQKRFAQELAKKVQERTMELERANLELKRSNENLEEFAYAASHDMKEPIRKIHFFADRLKQQLREQMNEEQNRLFSRMENAAQRMSTLIEDLLTYSHVSRGASQLENIDLNKKVQRVLEDLELEIEQQLAKVTVAHLPTITANRRQMQQLFQNLISNALKYSKPGVPPEIHITSKVIHGSEVSLFEKGMEANKPYHQIQIKDNGIGFEQSDAERIFHVFTRLHGNAEYRGSGVGLSIARKVVENHHGHIWAESKPGKGSTFKILLPVN
jgi:PAS domain S-box-containing protein